MQAWKEDDLQKALDKLPEVELPRRRKAADAGEKKRKGEDVDPALEAQSNEKKQKELVELCGFKDRTTNKPSEALIKACETVLQRRRKTTTSSDVWDAVKREYKVKGHAGYGAKRCLADATRLLHDSYEALGDAAKAKSPLRWLDASSQIKQGEHHRPDAQKKKKT